MRTWLLLLGGLLVWVVHFFGIYAIGEFAPNVAAVLGLTLLCLAVDIWLLVASWNLAARGAFDTWRRSVARGGAGLSLMAVAWQGLPALLA